MSRFESANGPPVPYSDRHPERFETPRGPAFVLPGETEPRECGVDPDMPPASAAPRWRHPVTVGYAHLKGRS